MNKPILPGQEVIVASTHYIKERDYWAQKLAGDIIKSTFPYDYDIHNERQSDKKTSAFDLQDETVSELLRIAGNANPRLHMILTAVLAILLGRYSGNTDIVIGTPIYDQGTEGEFVNTVLTLRIILENEQTFKECLLSVRQTIIEAVENQNYPLSVLPLQAEVSFSTSDLPLFDTAILLENIHNKQYLGDITPDIGFIFNWLENRLQMVIDYNSKLYREETIHRIGKNYLVTLNAVLAGLDIKINAIDILSDEEKTQLLDEFNNTGTVYSQDKTIPQLFLEQVEKAPDRIALVGADKREEKKRRREEKNSCVETLRATSLQYTYQHQITYRQLNEQSDHMAGALIEKGVLPNDIIGIMMERSLEMIIGIWGILKSGGAYLPIDPNYPQERIQYMLQDSKAKILIDLNSLNGCPRRGLQHSALSILHSNLSYVIYTSGSTGKPKGVLTTHANVVRVVKNTNYIDITPGDRLLQLSNYAFDGSVFDIYGALLNGAALILIKKENVPAADQLAKIIKRQQITVFFVTTALFNVLVDFEKESLKNVRKVLLGGERASLTHTSRALEFLGKGKIIHVYGPTETTVFATYYFVDKIAGNASTIPIGKPLANTNIYILDKNMNPAPIGACGEIYIGGQGNARGYLNNPELTAERFIVPSGTSATRGTFEKAPLDPPKLLPNYQSPLTTHHSPIYKTGDLARWLPDGNIEFVGRVDRQVKIRGFRLELEEIESRLLKHELVKEAVISIKEYQTGDKYICAYIVPNVDSSKIFSTSQLHDDLAKQLPLYMIPSYFIAIEKVPLTPNGKIDRNALPAPEMEAGSVYAPPANHLENELAEIWAETLDFSPDSDKKIGIDDNFFQIGGHSLKAAMVMAKIHKQLHAKVTLEDIFKYPTIRELAEFISQAEESIFCPIIQVEDKEYYALSSAQKRMHVLQQMDKTSTTYHIISAWILQGNIDKNKMENALRKIIHRHESLRTSFHIMNDKPVQRIHKQVNFEIEILAADVTNKREQTRAFDLEKAPLMRVSLQKWLGEKHLLIIDMHHIISDGISMEILVQDFVSFYSGNELPGLKIQYKDYAGWQNHNEEGQTQFGYWKEEFAGEIPVLTLPIDYTRPIVQSFAGAHINFEIDLETTRRLKSLAFETETTIYQVLLSLYYIFLSKISSQEDIVIGTPVAGRRHADLEKIIGMFVNTLAFRNYPTGEKTFSDFLLEVKENTLKALDNQEYQYEELVEQVVVNRDISRNPLFDVMFELQNIDIQMLEILGLSLVPYEYENNTAKFDLTFITTEFEGKILFSIQYCTKLFKQETIERFVGYFKKIIPQIIDNHGLKLKKIDIILDEEKRRLLDEFNNETNVYPNNKTIPQLFIEQVAKTPDHIALVGAAEGEEKKRRREEEKNRYLETFQDVETLRATSLQNQYQHQLSYRELNNQTNGLAQSLIEQGITSGDIVAIQLERSNEMIISILGVLKSGAAYMPINPKQPETRTQFMLKDSGAKLLATANDQEGEKVRRWEGEKVNSSNIAYIIYTSGSTGNPKGVPIIHANFSPLIHWGYKNLGINENDRVIQNLSYYFDWSVWEIFIALTTGASLHMISENILLNPEAEVEFILKNAITILHITPTQYGYLLNVGKKLSSLKYLFIGAEKLTFDMVERSIVLVNNDCRIFNMYGPTEATIISAALEINKTKYLNYKELTSIPIGSAAAGLLLVVLNKYGQLCPVKIVGELYIAGPGVANGYLNNPELTAERFNFNRSYRANRTYIFYKTGDLARWLKDGSIEFLGRIDHQVKIRGYRIELGEIENCLLAHPGIDESVVIVKDDYLCAYIVSVEEIPAEQLGEYVLKRLPGYMAPAYFVRIEKMPLNPNGKINTRALPAPERKTGENSAPRDKIETALAEICAGILPVTANQIGIDDDFFQLGLHSLTAAILVSRIHKKLNAVIPLAELFKTPNIRGISGYIRHTSEHVYESIMPVEEKEYYVLSFAQQRMYILQQMDLNSMAYNMPQWIPLTPHTPLTEEFDIERLLETFKKLIKRHDSLRTSFHMIGDQLVQRVRSDVAFKIEKTRWTDFVRPFNLSQAPLLRVGLTEGNRYLLVDMHHIISDGISHEVLREDFKAFYEGKELTPLRIQYKDFAQWQNSPIEVGRIHQQMLYWLNEFAGEIPVLELPLDYPRPLVQSFAGAGIDFEFPVVQTKSLNEIALQAGATLFMVLTALIDILLARLSSQEEIIIGIPTAGRSHSDLEKVIGMFVNTLAMKNYPRGQQRFRDFLAEVKERMLLVFENQEYPFEALVEKLALKRDTGRNPLFDVMFSWQNMSEEYLRKNDSQFEYQIAKFDLTFAAAEIDQKLCFSIQYCTKLFKQETIGRFISYFKKIISQIIANPGLKLKDIDIILDEEKLRLLDEFNNEANTYPNNKTIPQLFAEQVAKTPDHISLVGAAEGEEKKRRREEEKNSFVETLRATSLQNQNQYQHQISYRELNNQTNGLAQSLIKQGIIPGDIVAIQLERSNEMIISILGILKSGAAYMPLNPKQPEARTQFMLKDSGAKLLAGADELEGEKVRRWEGEKVNSSNLAYIIYTSGSTGNPKGVAITHANFSPLIHWGYQNLGINENDRVIQNLSYYFDWSVWEIFIALTTGASLHMISENILLNPEAEVEFILKNAITVLHITPTQYGYLLHVGKKLTSLKYLFIGAEKLTFDIIERSMASVDADCHIFNMYGPTEATIISAVLEIDKTQYIKYKELTSVPIGSPAAGLLLVVLNKYAQLCPVKIVGELYIAGPGVANGYLNNPELAAERFKFNRSYWSYRSSIFYKTGDLARWLDDGTIEFLGRIDQQVKIRGYRIELGEIENCLLTYPDIKECAVMIKDDYLCGYIVSAEEIPSEQLREYLQKRLPEYMVPAYFVRLEKLPLNPNGKINRQALPQPEISNVNVFAAPENELQEKLVEIWSEVLALEKNQISIDMDFFKIGGHSLKAALMIAKIHKMLNVKISFMQLFTKPIIRELAAYIKKMKKEKLDAIETAEQKEYYCLSSAQKRMYFMQLLDPASTTYNTPQVNMVNKKLDIASLTSIFKQIIQHHQSLRTSFEMIAEEPVQQIHEKVEFRIEYDEARWETNFESHLKNFIQPFTLNKAPLIRVHVVDFGLNYLLMIDMHHIITDGVSSMILLRDFNTLFRNRDAELPALRIQYKDYAEWQNNDRQKRKLKQQERYWLEQFAQDIPILDIPTDYPRPALRSSEGDIIKWDIEKELACPIWDLLKVTGCTLNIFFLAVHNVLLAKYTNQDDIVVGTVSAGRNHADLEQMVGMFVNMLAIRSKPCKDKTFKDFLLEIKKSSIDAYENQDYQFDDLVIKLGLQGDQARTPLFETVFIVQNLEMSRPIKNEYDGETDEITPVDIPMHLLNNQYYDLVFQANEGTDIFNLRLMFATALFKPSTAQWIKKHFMDIIKQVIENPDIKLMDISITQQFIKAEPKVNTIKQSDFRF